MQQSSPLASKNEICPDGAFYIMENAEVCQLKECAMHSLAMGKHVLACLHHSSWDGRRFLHRALNTESTAPIVKHWAAQGREDRAGKVQRKLNNMVRNQDNIWNQELAACK